MQSGNSRSWKTPLEIPLSPTWHLMTQLLCQSIPPDEVTGLEATAGVRLRPDQGRGVAGLHGRQSTSRATARALPISTIAAVPTGCRPCPSLREKGARQPGQCLRRLQVREMAGVCHDLETRSR